MGVASGCGCKEVYRFPHTTYPYSSCIYLFFFAAASLLFVHKNFFFSFLYIYIYIPYWCVIKHMRLYFHKKKIGA